jgi:hypothetical protein
MLFPSYSTGTVAIAANATAVVGTGSNWSGQNAIPGDLLVVAGQTVIISDVTDALHLAIDAWPYAAVTAGTAYKLYKVSPLRFVGGLAMSAVDEMVAALNTSGFYVFVTPTQTVPDPSLGQDNQYALQATTGKLWQKTGGTWNFIGIQKGFGLPAPWNSSTAYLPFDVVSLAGTSYVCILANTNQTPPNATFWAVLAAKGDAATVAVGTVTTGVGGSPAAVTNSGTSGAAVLNFTIPVAQGYGGTSTTSLVIANTVTRVFTTQAGLGYNGSRVRAASAANPANYMEGACTYSGTTLTMTVDAIGGSGTKADWVLGIAGQPGVAGAGALLAANNLSDVANAATARSNIGAASDYTVEPCGRLTLTSGTPVTTSDVAGATSVFYTPYDGDTIALYDGSKWLPIVFTETTLSLSGLTANTNYDVWGRINSGALALDTTAWTNDTTRATVIAQQNGIDVKSGDPTRRLLGTIRIRATGQTEDSVAHRFVSNRYNAEIGQMQALEPAPNWTYSVATFRQANANTANQLDMLLCTPRMVAAEAMGACQSTAASATMAIGIGINSTSSDSSTTRQQAPTPVAGGNPGNAKANWAGYLPAGRSTLVWLEQCSFANGGTMTMFGNPGPSIQCGITGAVAR